MTPDSVLALMRMARLLDAAVRVDNAKPGDLADALGRYLDALADCTGRDRAELDEMEPAQLRALMDRVCFGDVYGDAADAAREAWKKHDQL